jgi:hypothetical protein
VTDEESESNDNAAKARALKEKVDRLSAVAAGGNGFRYIRTTDADGRRFVTRASTAAVDAMLQEQTKKLTSTDVTRDASEEELVNEASDVESVSPDVGAQERRAKREDLDNQILEAERDRVRQQKGHRSKFFTWAVISISCVFAFNGSIFVWHMIATGGSPADAVIISWMSTSIVEVLGLGYIIARSLFLSASGAANGSQSEQRANGSS